MKNLAFFLAVSAFFVLLACKGGMKETAEEPLPASSFKIALVKHPVKDFEAWKPHYFGSDSLKSAYGLTHFTLGRGIDDPSMVLVSNKFTDLARVKEFAALPELKAAMDSAGVTGAPTFEYMEVVRFDTAKVDTKDRVIISHRVKDYDTWLKAYDAEGRATRKEHGVLDRGLARGIDDPNMVYVVFNIVDMTKARARIGSEDLKKIMTDAGVEGPPTIFFYTVMD